MVVSSILGKFFIFSIENKKGTVKKCARRKFQQPAAEVASYECGGNKTDGAGVYVDRRGWVATQISRILNFLTALLTFLIDQFII